MNPDEQKCLDLLHGLGEMESEVIKTPVTFDEEAAGYFLDGNGHEINVVDMRLDERQALGEHIANCINSHAALRQQVLDLTGEVERLREENRMVVTPQLEANLIECVQDEIAASTGSRHAAVERAIKDWFQILGEDLTSGMPEYENHRY